MSHAGDIIIVIERGIKRSRGLQQMTDNCLLFFAAYQALLDRHMCRQSCKDSQLTTEGLRRCDTNFRSGMGRQKEIGLARHRTCRHIHDHADCLTVFLAMPQSRKRIGRFSALGNEQREAAFLKHRFAIAELGSHIDVDRNPRELLEPVFRNHPCVIGCSAGNDGDALDARNIEIELWQGDRIIRLA